MQRRKGAETSFRLSKTLPFLFLPVPCQGSSAATSKYPGQTNSVRE